MNDLTNYLIIGLLAVAILLPLAVLINKAVKSFPRAKAENAGKPRCSFCGKTEQEVQKIIAGANVFICNECVALCSQIINEPPNPLSAFSEAHHRKDYETAVKALRPLAEDGNAQAQYWLGQMYWFGHGVTQDDNEAFKWFEKSADKREDWNNGCSAQYQLGTMYKNGIGVKQDDEEAYFWFLLAQRSGYANPADPDGYFAQGLTAQQRAEAEKRVLDWLLVRPIPVPRT